MSSSSKFGLSLTIEPVQREVTNFGQITKDNISIGPTGLLVDGSRVSSFGSLSDFEDTHELLGTGVSGSVRKVRHLTSGTIYAVKTMPLENSEEFLEKKLVELKTLMASKHPAIVRFFGAFYNDGVLSFVLEFMNNGTLADLLEASGAIPENILGRLTGDLLGGMDYLHKKLHLIHRDLKPQNILLNAEGEIKITDFGVSGEIAHTAAFAKTFVGTVKYMSPARIKGQKHSAKSDIWSFGIVVLESALGKYPYPDAPHITFFARLNDIVNAPVPIPSSGFTSPFCTFISKCLQKDENLLPTASELLEDPWIVSHRSQLVQEWIIEKTRKR